MTQFMRIICLALVGLFYFPPSSAWAQQPSSENPFNIPPEGSSEQADPPADPPVMTDCPKLGKKIPFKQWTKAKCEPGEEDPNPPPEETEPEESISHEVKTSQDWENTSAFLFLLIIGLAIYFRIWVGRRLDALAGPVLRNKRRLDDAGIPDFEEEEVEED